MIVIPPSVITQRHDRIILAVICATYRLSGLSTQMQFYVSFLLSKSGRNDCTLTVDLATFSQFVIKANKFLLSGSQSVVAIFLLIRLADEIVNHLIIMINKVPQKRGKTAYFKFRNAFHPLQQLINVKLPILTELGCIGEGIHL